jgi:hypothetical protein
MFAATIAAVIALATLPFFVAPFLTHKDTYFWFNEAFAGLIFIGGVFSWHRVRTYAIKWVHFQGEDYYYTPRWWIDQVEKSPLQRSPTRRATETILFMLFFAVLGAAYVVVAAYIWFLR